jgi:prepilin-type processing-associated H-X9-DG protein
VEALALLLCFAGVVWGFRIGVSNMRAKGCEEGLHELSLAMSAYLKDYNRYPSLRQRGIPATYDGDPYFGWGGALLYYGKSTKMFFCPEAPDFTANSNRRGFTDHWMNANLDQARPESCAFPSATLLFGEGNDGTDKTDGSYSLAKFPDAWQTDADSPTRRHRGSANYVFVDGSGRRLAPSDFVQLNSKRNPFALN